MSYNKSIVGGAILAAVFAFAVVGCEKKEESLGTKLDKAAEKTKEAAKDGAEKAKEGASDAADKAKDAVK